MLIIEADMVVQGQLTIVGTVLIEGRFEGSIVCSRLEIGVDGYLNGRAIAGEIDVAGQVVGEVHAREVYLRGTALVEGEVRHEQLRMDEAAALVGESKRHNRLEMPPAFLALENRARMAESDFRNLETTSRVRHAQEALNAKAQFETLRARFPSPTGPASRASA
ncbi:MAG: polymer-forming cytoskeletal protein [Hyphomicrobiaceae bacterium]